MFLARVLAMDAATRSRGPLFVDSDENSDLDTAPGAGDSGLEDNDDPDVEEEIEAKAGEGDDPDGKESEAETAKRTRFKDHDAAEEGFTELQRHNGRVEQDNAELRRQLAERELKTPRVDPAEMNEAMLVQASEAVATEYQKLPKEQQNLQGATRIMLKHVVEMNRRQALQVVEAQTTRAQAQADSIAAAKKSMVAVGLDPDLHWDLYNMQNEKLYRADPNHWRGKSADQQFQEIATKTVSYMKQLGIVPEALKKAKDDHNREAGGTMHGSSRRSPSAKTTESDDDQDDTMGAELNANRASLRRRSTAQYQVLNRTGAGVRR